MAITHPTPWVLPNFDDPSPTFKITDTAIGGKLVRCTMEFTAQKVLEFGSEHAFNDFVKTTMTNDIAKYMLDNHLIEFTRRQDPKTLNTVVRARCYLATDEQIRILRTHYNV